MARVLSQFRVSLRVGVPHYESDEAFAKLLELLKEFRFLFDEVALFETVTHHLYLPLELLAERAEIIRRRLTALREHGVASVGINVVTTIGHINEGWDYMPRLPFQPMVGHDGSVSLGCACPNTPEMREYVRAKYTLMAQAGPDFIWVDDDIRMHNHGVAYGCFCETCLELFSEETAHKWEREPLVRALNEPDQTQLRRQWVEHNMRTLETLLAAVREAIHAVNPSIQTGLMTAGPGWTTYSGQAFDRWFAALAASKARPGGGFYSDVARLDVLTKAFEVGRQCASLPESVVDRQYELENFPYQALRKAAGSVVNECTLALAAGTGGVAVNTLPMWGPPYDDYVSLFRRMEKARPLWEAFVAWTNGLPITGLWGAWRDDLCARRRVLPGENWFAFSPAHNINWPNVLAEIGLPMSVERPGCGTVLAGRIAECFEDNELREMLSGSVLMDAATLEVLDERGLAHLAGVRVAERYDNGVMERFSDDVLNGEHVGHVRDARIEFWGPAQGQANVLEPIRVGVRTLAVMEDYFCRPRGPCLTAYENELGGRVAVMGYAPWMFLHSAAKRYQLLNLADWLTRGRLPVRIYETVPLIPFVRLSPGRKRGAVVLLNSGLDTVEKATVEVRSPEIPVWMWTEGGVSQLEPQVKSGGWQVTLTDILPWTTVCLFLGEKP